MAYDADLADRIRELLPGALRVSEQAMFGGLAFLVDGNMAIAASGQGGVLVRVDPDDSARLSARGAAEPMVMRGRAMAGWLHVDDGHVRTKRQLQKWVDVGISYASSLTPKQDAKRVARTPKKALAKKRATAR